MATLRLVDTVDRVCSGVAGAPSRRPDASSAPGISQPGRGRRVSRLWKQARTNRWALVLGGAALVVAVLHLTRLGASPPGLYQDEATNGYQGWSLAHYGRDEHGHLLPLYFETFGDW